MTKRAFLIHGWEGTPEHGWLPWLKRELESKGFRVVSPAMPHTKHPNVNEWVNHLTKLIGVPDQETYLVGHSLGCITILRYLEKLKSNQKIGGAVLVAGFTSDLGYEDLESFFIKSINWNKIKSHCRKFVALHSDNDPYVSLHYGDFFRDKLGAEVMIKHNMGHFSGDNGITVLPPVLNAILKQSKS